MPRPRKPVLGKGELHLITSTCLRHQEKLVQEKHRDLLCQLLEQLRVKYRFRIVGYVVMPSNFHILLSEPEMETAEEVIMTLRQRFQRRYNTSVRMDESAWEKKITDKHVVGSDQIVSTLTFLHEAPVKAGHAVHPTDWEWSSARSYAGLSEGVVTVDVAENVKARLEALSSS
jgi:putative transposase